MADERTDKLLRKSFQEIQQLRLALQEAKGATLEPIAIVGMACRAPGGVSDPEAYWTLLDEGRDAIEPFPARFSPERVYDADPDALGKSYVREGGFLRDAELFDADFFGISPREAVQMEPQQRVLLEAAWEALERSGINPSRLHESRTGVYVGAMCSDYGLEDFSLEALDGYRTTGVIGSVLSGRLSYVLGLQGPSMTVDTACSSSLAALHLACTGLRQGECDLALAGGVTVMCTASLFVEFSRLRASAPDGRCKAFSDQADGAGWSEGCGVLVLKRLKDAQRDGDRVLAVIRGSAVNQDGKSQGLTAPNGPSQTRLIRRALEVSGLGPQDIDAIEAHGTGTSLGDPIEANALAEVFGQVRAERPVWLGSSKSNLGHTQAAAGVLGVIKMVLALEHERLPRTLHADKPSRHVAWEASGLQLLQEPRAWPRAAERPRRAGVSSFGIGGTNAHVVLEEAPAAPAEDAASSPLRERTLIPLLVAGHEKDALKEQAARWAVWLRSHPATSLHEVVASAALQRVHGQARAALVVSNLEEAIEALQAVAGGQPHDLVTLGSVKERRGAVFVFPGQGSQWAAMGRSLLAESQVFASAVEQCDAALRPHTGWSVAAILRGDASPDLPPADRVDVVQPALFTMSIALSAVWRSFGVEPAAVVGHSQGEIAAAVVSGALSLEDGARVVAVRSKLLLRLAGSGGMAAIELPVTVVEEHLKDARWADLGVAVVNTATSTVVAGKPDAIAAWVEHFNAQGVFCRRINVDYASHSAQVEPILTDLRSALAPLQPRDASVALVSTVTGDVVAGHRLDASYWCNNLRQPVRLDRALEKLLSTGHDVFVEVSPHPALVMALNTACAARDALVVHSLARESGELSTLYRSLGALHVGGARVDWAALLAPQVSARAELPTYAFQRRRYWREASRAVASDVSSLGLCATHHPLLGVATPLASGERHVFSGRLAPSEQSWLLEHGVFGTVLFPGTGLLELAAAAARHIGATTVAEIILENPLSLPREASVQVQLQVEPEDGEGKRGFAIYSRPDEQSAWTRNATGALGATALEAPPLAAELALKAWPPASASALDLTHAYDRLAACGYDYGPAFQGLREAYAVGDSIYARVQCEDIAAQAGQYGVHPALLDAALHAMVLGALKLEPGFVWLPFGWSGVCLDAAGASELRVKFSPSQRADDEMAFAVIVADARGRVVLRGGLQVRRVAAAQLRAALDSTVPDLYRMDWQSVALPASSAAALPHVIARQQAFSDALDLEQSAEVRELLARMHGGLEAPSTVVIEVSAPHDLSDDNLVATTHATAERALLDLQLLLAEPRLSHTSLVWLIRGSDGGHSGLSTAPLWGMLRSARRENADRAIRVVQLDTASVEPALLMQVLLQTAEPELKLVSGGAMAPRLVRVRSGETRTKVLPADRTVLITGGLGELGQAVARHLVASHGARHLVLTSRRGLETQGAAEVVTSLKACGAETVEIVSCDVADAAALRATLDTIPGTRPLGAVFHLAAALEDGLVVRHEKDALHRVLRPKVDGAFNLHALTASQDLACFVVFSSVAGTLGTLGQASYAGANTFLDALAEQRQRRGLPALSLAWGLWQQQGIGLTAHLTELDLARMRAQGIAPFSVEAGLALLDASLSNSFPALVPSRLEVACDATGAVSEPLFRALHSNQRRPAPASGTRAPTLQMRLVDLSDEERTAAVLQVVRREIASVLRLPDTADVADEEPLRSMGLDSLMSVELRNRLSAQAGITLPATLAFNYPTASAIAGFVLEKFQAKQAPAVEWNDDAIQAKLRRVSIDALKKSGLLAALMAQPDAPASSDTLAVDDGLQSILDAENESLLALAERMLQDDTV